MKRYLILLLSTLVLLLQGCKDKTEYCPCYPQEKTDYMPIDFIGKTMHYIIDNDTITFKVLQPVFSEEYAKDSDKAIHDAGLCKAQAMLYLTSNDTTQVLTYGIYYYSHSEKYCLIVDYYDRVHSVYASGGIENIYQGAPDAELLPQWTSPTGQTYTDVLKAVFPQTETDSDTLYLSKQYGLLHRYIYGGHTLTLLP